MGRDYDQTVRVDFLATGRAADRAEAFARDYKGTRYWHLGAHSLAGERPAPGDRLTKADGTAWVLKTVAKVALGSEFSCSAERA